MFPGTLADSPRAKHNLDAFCIFTYLQMDVPHFSILYQAAMIASSRNRDFIAYYTNKLRGREKEKGIKTKMRVKLAAKLCLLSHGH